MQNILNNLKGPKDLKKLNQEELTILAEEIRTFLIENISKTGGHIASNLGVVELTIAIHKIFDSPKDKILWDVGHQTYVHKILTDRKQYFNTLRQFKGLSGFPKKNESVHDLFDTGHSSSSISIGLGMAKARDLKKEDHNVVSIIGDGALTGGMAFEALNHAGDLNTDLIVVLNDNCMSICENVGGMSKYLNRLRTDPKYFKLKSEVSKKLNNIPIAGNMFAKGIERLKDSIKYLVLSGVLFEELGFTYLGPVDGHDIAEMAMVFERAKNVKGPVLIHTMTTKGKGLVWAEKHPDQFHGIGPFDIETGKLVKKSSEPSYSALFGKKLVKLAEQDERIVAVSAAMPDGTGLNEFREKLPERFFDVGIAEQHAVSFAAGLATQNLVPFIPIYSTFFQRAYDQIIEDTCLQNLPMILCLDRSGVVGADGETHHGVFDLSYLSHIPNLTIMAPKDGFELEHMMEHAIVLNSPVAIRYPRGEASSVEPALNERTFSTIYENKAEILKTGDELCFIAVGKMVKLAYQAAKQLENIGINVSVINARFIKPLDHETILSHIKDIPHIITVEDNVVIGGFGSMILNLLNSHNMCDKTIKILGWPDQFIEHGSVDELLEAYGLSSKHLFKTAMNLLKK